MSSESKKGSKRKEKRVSFESKKGSNERQKKKNVLATKVRRGPMKEEEKTRVSFESKKNPMKGKNVFL
jgi:hypothetical protein